MFIRKEHIMENTINIKVLHPTTDAVANIKVLNSLTVLDVLDTLVRDAFIPKGNYDVILKDSDQPTSKNLDHSRSLEANGVKEGSTLRLMTVLEAGCSSTPTTLMSWELM
jgi:hypothetical protein